MKTCLKQNTLEKQAAPNCKVVEYPLQDKRMDLALATLEGRYPDKGWVLNQVSVELAYILEGEGVLVTQEKRQPLAAGDALLIEAGEKYYWEGHMKILMSCSPPWTLDQHHFVD